MKLQQQPIKLVEHTMIEQVLNAPKTLKKSMLVVLDFILVSLSCYLAISIYSNRAVPDGVAALITVLTSAIAVYAYKRIGLYDSVVRFMTDDVFRSIIIGISFSSSAFLLFSQLFSDSIPLVASLVFSSMAFLLTSMVRFMAKDYIKSRIAVNNAPVIVYGAGSAGRQLVSALQVGEDYNPVAFLDDDKKLQGKRIHGIKVYSSLAIGRLIQEYSVRKVLLAIPSATPKQRNRVISILEKHPIEVKTVAGAAEIIGGRVKISQLRDVAIEDLLGREPVLPVQALMSKCIENKSVLVTGAGGSIGSELCRQIISCKPRKLILFEMSEFALYSIERELNQMNVLDGLSIEITPILGSVVNRPLLDKVMASMHVDTVYHAAAYKHVPLVEYNIVEGVQNNVFGTLNCAQAAKAVGVRDFVLVSTDKAVRPTNFMGATKRVAELVLQALAVEDGKTNFSMVRFGNVLGSSGSVVPLFKEQIESGGPVTVTHKDITRYFMTIPEASQLVIQAGAMAKGGDVFVLDMGEPVKISDLATKMIHLMGYDVKDVEAGVEGIEIAYTGLRPGEKLYEELLIGTDVEGTVHPRIHTANEVSMNWKDLQVQIEGLKVACSIGDCGAIKDILLDLPIEFNHKAIMDHFWDDLEDAPLPRQSKVISMNATH